MPLGLDSEVSIPEGPLAAMGPATTQAPRSGRPAKTTPAYFTCMAGTLPMAAMRQPGGPVGEEDRDSENAPNGGLQPTGVKFSLGHGGHRAPCYMGSKPAFQVGGASSSTKHRLGPYLRLEMPSGAE